MPCQRKILFDGFDDAAKKQYLLETIPDRYIAAETEHLRPALRQELIAENNTGVLLWGEPGRGKTYAMCALIKKYMAEGFLVRRVHYEQLCLQLRDTFNPKATQTEWSIIEPLLNCDKLFIEDVGTSKSIGQQESDFSLRTFIVLLDMRLERLRPTFITSNKSVESLGKSFDERVGDRLRLFKVLKLSGESLRK
jgi:DNA replication protein DnaC